MSAKYFSDRNTGVVHCCPLGTTRNTSKYPSNKGGPADTEPFKYPDDPGHSYGGVGPESVLRDQSGCERSVRVPNFHANGTWFPTKRTTAGLCIDKACQIFHILLLGWESTWLATSLDLRVSRGKETENKTNRLVRHCQCPSLIEYNVEIWMKHGLVQESHTQKETNT